MGTATFSHSGDGGLFLEPFTWGACPRSEGAVISGANRFSFLTGQDLMRLSLLMSLVRTFSTGWNPC
jgi:hypothetical protein